MGSTQLIRKLLLLSLLVMLGNAFLGQAQADCPLPPRLQAGVRAQVETGSGAANRIREAPGLDAEITGAIVPGGRFRVLDGPRCADGYQWWQVQYGSISGWTAEGSPSSGDYWLEALTAPIDPALEDLDFCQEPPDDYSRVDFGFAQLNQRTVAMLDQATNICQARGGLLSFDFRDALVQGSYNPGEVAASFGTHDGGGAVDLSVRERGSFAVMEDEFPLMLRALRIAGFAAWLRDTGELYPNSPIHIHAIAIGDRELSEAARGQIDGPFGYLRGFNGLPQENGPPLLDTSGEMVICPWMVAHGFDDLRDMP